MELGFKLQDFNLIQLLQYFKYFGQVLYVDYQYANWIDDENDIEFDDNIINEDR